MERLADSTLSRTTFSAIPSPMPPTSVRGSERMRAMRLTTSARSSRGGARAALPVWAALTPSSGAKNRVVAAESAPAMPHSAVEMRRVGMP